MRRKLYERLCQWKEKNKRKPLLIKGARQVGKTYLLKAFGCKEYNSYHHFDFVKNTKIHAVFEGDLDPLEIIKKINIQMGLKIDPLKELVIFDEIQNCPRALTSLKYFNEDLPEAHIIGSGSFLGLSLAHEPYPVGKIETVTLYPMSFSEFLAGLEQEMLLGEIKKGIHTKKLDEIYHQKTFEFLKYYFITGGLPEVVSVFKEYFEDLPAALVKTRELQQELCDNYKSDIAKHAGKVNAAKIQAVFDQIPIQLSRHPDSHAKKFIFKDVLSSQSNFIVLEDPIAWLEKAGMIFKVPIVKCAKQPLKTYTDHNRFKLFLFDVGLLGAMIGLEPRVILSYDYGSYKGFFAENYVVGEFKTILSQEIFSWQENTSEIEFLISHEENLVPIEVKAGINKKAKSMKVFRERYQPCRSFLISANPIALRDQGLSLIPLYLAGMMDEIL